MHTKMISTSTLFLRQREHGVVLFTALILLLVLTLSGVMLARMQMGEQRMARNDSNHQIALEAAEAALRATEVGLNSGGPGYNNFTGSDPGLYTLSSSTGNSAYWPANWMTVGAAALTYGGATLVGPALAALNVPQAPSVIIEELPAVATPGSGINHQSYNSPAPPTRVHRITSYSVGGDQSASAIVQSVVLN